MKKKLFILLLLVLLACGTAFSLDLTKVNTLLGPNSFTLDVYAGYVTDNLGVNLEWGIGELPLTIGMGLSPLVIGEYALRVGYHPDLGIDFLDVYANLTLGVPSLFFIPGFAPIIGLHVGARYFFTQKIGAFAELGYSSHVNFIKAGLAIKFD